MTAQQRARSAIEVPLLKFLGARPLDERDLTRGLALSPSPRALNAVGGVHVGALATLMEVAAYLAVVAQLSDNEEAITHAFSANYMAAPTDGAALEASGDVLRRGGNLAFVAVEVRAGDTVIAVANVTKSIRRSG